MAQESFFSRSYSHVFALWKMRHILLGRTMQEILQNKEGNRPFRIIDIGCGDGTNLFEVCDSCSNHTDLTWYGLDLDRKAIQAASERGRYRQQVRKLEPPYFITGHISDLPVNDRFFDIVLCTEVMEHIPNPESAISELARIIKPEGFALITTPNPRNLPEGLGYLIDRLTFGWFKRRYWAGQDEITAPRLSANVGQCHVSVHPCHVWRKWFDYAGFCLVRKIRGPMILGSPFFDRHRILTGLIISLDPLLDKLPGRLMTSVNLGLLFQKRSSNDDRIAARSSSLR